MKIFNNAGIFEEKNFEFLQNMKENNLIEIFFFSFKIVK